MEEQHPMEVYRLQVKPALISKVEEFKLLGYDRVSEDEVWKCLTEKTWKKVKQPKRLHETVQDILTLRATDYMNFLAIEAYKGPDWFVPSE